MEMVFNPAGFWRRYFAFLLDGVINICLSLVVLLAPIKSDIVLNFLTGNFNQIAFAVCSLILLSIVMTIYSIVFVGIFGGTLGKILFGIKIVDRDTDQTIGIKRAFFRTYIGYVFSSQFFGLGFFRIMRNPERLGWHDELFNTKVIIKRSPLLGAISLIVIPVLTVLFVYNFAANIFLSVQDIDYRNFINITQTLNNDTLK